MVIQFTELPNGSILSSIVSTGKWNLGAKNDSDCGNGGYTEGLEIKSNATSLNDFLGKNNNLDSEDGKDPASRTSIEKAWTPKPNDSAENVMEKKEREEFSLSTGSHVSSGPVSETLNAALTPAVSVLDVASPSISDFVSPVESVDPGFSSVQNNVKSKFKTDAWCTKPTQRNFNSTTNIPPQPDFSILHTLSISEMTELLLQSRSFPHSEPPKWYSSTDQELHDS